MDIGYILNIINKKKTLDEDVNKIISKSRDMYYSITLHTKGVRPSFKDLSKNNNVGYIYPPSYIDENYQILFEKFILAKHPREEEVTRWWRYSQYKPLTKYAFQKIITVVKGLIYQDTKHALSIDDHKNEEYLKNNNFLDNNNFISLFKNIFIQSLMEDPNGYIVIIPSKHRTETINDSNPLDVSFLYVKCINVIYQDKDNLVYKTNDGNYIYWINQIDIIRFTRGTKENKKEWIKEEDGYYSHKFGFKPAIRLGGIYDDGIYRSFIDDAIPIADEFISSYSSEQLIDKEASHPYIQQATVQCPECKGIGTKQESTEVCEMYPNGLKQVTCHTCSGKKTISINPSERYEVPIDEMGIDMVKIINPDVGVNQYHRSKNKEIFLSLLDALNLLKVDEAQSGLAKTIDRDNLYQFTSNVSDRLFELKDFCLKCFIAYRSVSPKFNGGYSLQKPYKFDTQNAQELLKEITTAQNNGTPFHIRKYMINDFVNKRYKGNDVDIKINQIYANLDRTFGMTLQEVQIAKELGFITSEDIDFSRNLRLEIENMLTTKSNDYVRDTSVKKLIDELIKNI